MENIAVLGSAFLGALIVGWILLALNLMVAGYAQSKGRSAVGWFGAGMLVSPAITILMLLVLGRKVPLVCIESWENGKRGRRHGKADRREREDTEAAEVVGKLSKDWKIPGDLVDDKDSREMVEEIEKNIRVTS